jgi:hypothetical protein
MTEESSFIDAALSRINPVPASEVAALVTESDTTALLKELRRRRSWSRWQVSWRSVLSRLGIIIVLIFASAGATAVAIKILRSTSDNPSSVACYYSVSTPWEGVALPPSSAPVLECASYWSQHHRSTSRMKFKACVLQSGIVGVFGGRGKVNPCATLNLLEFTSYSSPRLVQLDQSLARGLGSIRCPSASVVISTVKRDIALDHIRGWLVQNELAHAPSGTCATFEFKESSPPAVTVNAKYDGPTLSQPPNEAASITQWRNWARRQREVFMASDWKRALSTSLCRALRIKINESVSNGAAGVPKGVATKSVSVVGTCKP